MSNIDRTLMILEGKGFEAHGVKGMKSKPWKKVFKSQEAFEKWLDANEGDVEVYATRDLGESRNEPNPYDEGYECGKDGGKMSECPSSYSEEAKTQWKEGYKESKKKAPKSGWTKE